MPTEPDATSKVPSSPAPPLCADELWVDVGDRTVLRGLSLSVEAGEVLGILGPSGAGKSTLFRTLAGELPPTRGTVTLGGRDVARLQLYERARLGLGYIPQEPTVFWDLSVQKNLLTFAELAHLSGDSGTRASIGQDPAARRMRVEELIQRVGLQDRAQVLARSLSAGERRRLEFARALTSAPRVLLCDEPFAGVDPSGAARLGAMLHDLSRAGVAVILADHHVEEALTVCNRALLVLDGTVAVAGTPAEFRAHPTVVGRYLGTFRRSIPPPH